MNLFQRGDFLLHSGKRSRFKIDCDALTTADWETVADIIKERFVFSSVIGVPQGGLHLARALQPYCTPESVFALIVDDVFTTGRSMEKIRSENFAWDPSAGQYRNVANIGMELVVPRGVVLFARGPLPSWIHAIFYAEI